MANVLVVGGAGYVGSATCAWLLDRGHSVWVLDDLSTGHREAVLTPGFTRAQAGDREAVTDLIQKHKFDCVMHFAAKSIVSESVREPDIYHENNVIQTRTLLETLLEHGIRRFIFSSTCAVFGEPGNNDIHEALPKSPINPYGRTKLEAELMMEELARDRGLQVIALRYFNAAGAEPKARVGERHHPETHLIPNVLAAAADGTEVKIFGDDYPTHDGTCIRDYIHVWDLSAAHEAAMNRLLALPESADGRFEAFNLGSGTGYSVRQVIEACQKITGIKILTRAQPRRPGDPPRLVANANLARSQLGISISNPEDALKRIIASAWSWEQKKKTFKKAVFLDRDGTINIDPGYISQPEQMMLIPRADEALAALKRAGFLLVVISNQSGVGRGIIQEETIPRIHAQMDALLSQTGGVKIDHYELCFHRPEDGCDCRKPKSQLLATAARTLGIDLTRSFMVGDKRLDTGAGRSAGCQGVALVRTGHGSQEELNLKPGDADFVGDDLFSVSEWILSQENAGS